MLLIKNGRIVIGTGEIIDGGDILIEENKILKVGKNLEAAEGSEVIDASGKWVTPGFIDAHTHISMMNSPNYNGRINDLNEKTNPITPALHAADSINPRDRAIAKARSAGFTTVCSLPGSANLMCGFGVTYKLKEAQSAREMILNVPEPFKMAVGENPKRIYGDEKKTAPITRMAVASMIRENFYKAMDYGERCEDAEKKGNRIPFDYQMNALLPVLKGERRVRIHCHRADDIITAISLAEEFHLKYSLEHVTEGYLISDYLAEKHAECVLGPLALNPTKFETDGISWENPAKLEQAGIRFSLMQDAGYDTYLLPMYAGRCVAFGLTESTAFRALTIHPAALLGLENRIGSIEEGKDADLAIFSGHPLSSMSVCETTVIDGVVYGNTI